jgi:hypothetical protein
MVEQADSPKLKPMASKGKRAVRRKPLTDLRIFEENTIVISLV